MCSSLFRASRLAAVIQDSFILFHLTNAPTNGLETLESGSLEDTAAC